MKIYYATSEDINVLGAPRSIDIPMVENLNQLGHEVSWFGINIDKYHSLTHENVSLKHSNLKWFLTKVKNRILRNLKVETVEDQKLNAQRKFDKWQASIFEQRKNEIDGNLVFIGRSVSSELSFKTIKKYGGYCILHSQWMHPETHNRILKKAFFDLNIKYDQALKERIEIQKREIELCDKIWCISQLVFDSYLQNGVPKEKLLLCPLGVDTNVFKPTTNNSKDNPDKYVILFVGNINIEKGIHVLLNALMIGKIANCQLILNGAVADFFIPILQDYTERLRDLNVEVVIKSGFPLKNLQKANLFVLPSLHDSFGLVVLEAMACGLPIIVTDQVGASEHIISGENGFIVPANSAEKLSEKIRYFFENRDQQDAFGKKSYSISQALSWSSITQKFMDSVRAEIDV